MTTIVLIGTLTIIAVFVASAMIILAVGRQSEERRGYLDLTGIKPRHDYEWPSASRVRAEAGPFVGEAGSDDAWPVLSEQGFSRCRLGAIAVDQEPAETELARQVATQQQPRGADAA